MGDEHHARGGFSEWIADPEVPSEQIRGVLSLP